MRSFDVAVIGSGSGGAHAARLAAQRGARVILIERELLGGTCLHSGCVPLSMLARNARRWRELRTDPLQQVSRPPALLADWIGSTRRHVAKQSAQMYERLRTLGVSMEGGQGKLEGAGRVVIERNSGSSEAVRANSVILATGARPRVSRFPGHVDVRGLLHSCDEPKELTIVGGGHIGCEFAGIFNALGSKVTIFEKGATLCPELDPEAGIYLQAMFRSRGVGVHVNTLAASGTAQDSAGAVQVVDEAENPAAAVLWATGRVPNTEGLGLLEARVDLQGECIGVDAQMRTSAPGIYAIGDVTGLDGLATGARAQAQIAVENIFGGNRIYEPNQIARCYWTQPAIACVGLDEKAALAAGYDVRIGRSQNTRDQGDQGINLVKLVSEARTGRLLGGIFIGEHAGDLISVVALALRHGAKVDDLCPSVVSPAISDALEECQEQIYA